MAHRIYDVLAHLLPVVALGARHYLPVATVELHSRAQLEADIFVVGEVDRFLPRSYLPQPMSVAIKPVSGFYRKSTYWLVCGKV